MLSGHCGPAVRIADSAESWPRETWGTSNAQGMCDARTSPFIQLPEVHIASIAHYQTLELIFSPLEFFLKFGT